VWRWRLLAAGLILGAAGFHLAYLLFDCPLDLAPDEAHYWDWSRHLDWSYYSKGPLVAWLIRAACWLAGDWSRQLVGSEMIAVRLPAIVSSSLLLTALYTLTMQMFRRDALAAAVVAMALTLPVVVAGGSLMTIDAPYTCCWGWALVTAYSAIFRGARWAWPVTGLIVGLGLLAKYTMVLFVPSLGLFLLLTDEVGQTRRLRFRRGESSFWLVKALRLRFRLGTGFWIMSAVAGVCSLPIALWNAQHGWVSLHHVSGQAGLHHENGILWLGPLSYVGMQCLLLLGFWFVAWILAMVRYRPWREQDPSVACLWWMSAPMFAVFLLFSLKTREEPNWPVTAYLSGIVLTAFWLQNRLREQQSRLLKSGVVAIACLGLLVSFFMHHSEWARPLLRQASGEATTARPLPLRRFDPTCRLRGWRTLAAAVDAVREELRGQGVEPILAAGSWTLPGELGFYCQGNPAVYSLGLALGDRHSQHDLWQPNPLADPEMFRGKTFIFVGEVAPTLREAFAEMEPTRLIIYREKGDPIAQWKVTVCRGFIGFSRQPDQRRY
jgi:4-amino-4-deoxy-L-arabinose transferase-like glycosyltransferase